MEVGRALRRQREALGYTLADVHAATKIRVRYLEAMEAGRFGDLPGPVYARGFIRLYGNFLELDGGALAAAWGDPAPAEDDGEVSPSARREHDATTAADEPPPQAPPADAVEDGAPGGEQPPPPDRPPRPGRSRPQARAAPPPPDAPAGNSEPQGRRTQTASLIAPALLGTGRPSGAPPGAPGKPRPPAVRAQEPWPARPAGAIATRRRPPVLALWVLALVAAVAAVVAWQVAARRTAAPAAAHTVTTPAADTVPTARPTGSAAVKPASPAPAAVPTLTATSGTDSTGQPLRTYRVAGAGSLTVVATASARCWVRVWLDGSSRYTDHTLLAGQSLTWHAQRQIALRIGYPLGLHLVIDGRTPPAFRTRNPVDAAIVLAPAAAASAP